LNLVRVTETQRVGLEALQPALIRMLIQVKEERVACVVLSISAPATEGMHTTWRSLRSIRGITILHTLGNLARKLLPSHPSLYL
jgi:hypothetical protein